MELPVLYCLCKNCSHHSARSPGRLHSYNLFFLYLIAHFVSFLPYTNILFSLFFFCIQHSRATTQNVWVNKAAQIHDITLKNLRYTSIKKGERNEERNTQGISSRPSCIFVKYNAHTFLGESLLSVIR